MLTVPLSRETCRAAKGSALVIVLFFIILMTVVTIAFLSRSLTAVKVSASSTGETKSKILASSASDIIIGDFKQEIVAGSTSAGANGSFPVYLPVTNATSATAPFATTMIPWQNGVPLLGSPATNAIPNMISRSVSTNNITGTAPYVAYPSFYTAASIPPPRAAGDSSAANPTLSTTTPYTTSKVNSSYPSLNGRLISPAQWNSHYLIPRNTSVDALGSTSTDSTPVSNFVTPDWVIVTRAGANSVTWSNTPGTGLTDPVLTNTNYAIGRYAYAVYNEGGLLDMNAAGYPADPTSPGGVGSNGLTSAQSSEKMGLPLADLTQLTAGSVNLTQTQINNIVGWRNYASAELSGANGSYGSFSFTAATASNWLTNFVSGNTNGFLQVIPPPAGVTTPPTDQVFLSRQQLINLTQSLSISPDFLQYMGTFSRALEQPSMAPDPARPKVLTGSVPVQTVADGYLGNNDNQTKDTDPTGVNPSFLSIRAGTGITRLNGTAAVSGEPLVKTKFPLSYLTWLTYKGPSASRTSVSSNTASAYSSPSSSDYDIYLLEYKYGTSNALLQQGTAANILTAFGLTYNKSPYSSTNPPGWTYGHVSGQNTINTLALVSGREADFAELLKATIIAGSVGKGGPNLNSNLTGTNPANSAPNYNYQYTVDTISDLQVLQIMANLIDQQSVDSYPTDISMATTAANVPLATVYGVKDLPYFYRYHLFCVVDKLPSPLLSESQTVTFPAIPSGTSETGTTPYATAYPSGTVSSGSWSVTNTTSTTVNYCALGSISSSNRGEVSYLYVPSLWNPHDPNTVSTENSSLRPAQFRIFAATEDPVATTNPWTPVLESQISGTATVTPPNPNPTNIQAVSGFNSIIPETPPSPPNPATTYFWPMANTGNTYPPQSYPIPSGGQGAATPANVTLTFSDNNGTLFREPTLLWNTNPTGIGLLPATSAHVSDAPSGGIPNPQTYYGIIIGQAPISTQMTLTSTPAQATDGTYVVQGGDVFTGAYSAGAPIYSGLNLRQSLGGSNGTSFPQVTFFLQYQDPNNANNWITYDVKYPDLHGMSAPTPITNIADFPANSDLNPLDNGRFSGTASSMDPRSARWGVGTAVTLGNVPGQLQESYALEPLANANILLTTTSGYQNTQTSQFSVFETNRSRVDPGDFVYYSNPCMTSNPAFPIVAGGPGIRNLQMRWFGQGEYRAGSWYNSGTAPAASPGNSTSPVDYDGFFSQNNPAIQPSTSPTLAQNSTSTQQLYNEDPDGVARPAMGAYATTSTVSGASTVGLPLVTANTYNNNAVGVATSQSQSRPIVLNRPFRSVSEMSYAFRGTPWKSIDFFHPASGDSALLDTFCVTAPPANAMVAGKVDLNTRQIPVLQAVAAGAYIDEINNAATTPPSYALPGLTGTEAANVATTLEKITSDTSHAWRGPLKNISGLVGRFVANPGATTDTDLYTYSPPALASGTSLPTVNYAGLSSALDCSSFFGVANHVYANPSTPLIQRFREAALRPLAAAGQVRVWNLLIDVVAQTGHYPKTATGLDQFSVDGQTRLWVHVAIDRYTGQVIDKQVEVVTP